MGLFAAIVGGIGAICTALGIVNILEVTDTPILSDKLTWGFWFALAVILFLAAITLLLGRSPGQGED
jgi:hypothetical protein